MVKIKYNDKVIEVNEGTRVIDAFANEIKENCSLGCKFNNEVKSLEYKLFY